jgi:hypothetical protein
VTLTSDTVQYNTAATAGGGLYVGAGTVTLTNDTVQSNKAATAGGGLYVAAGTVTLTSDKVQSNTAGTEGGGMYITSGAVVYLDAFTLNNVINNTAPKHKYPNIDGSFQRL